MGKEHELTRNGGLPEDRVPVAREASAYTDGCPSTTKPPELIPTNTEVQKQKQHN